MRPSLSSSLPLPLFAGADPFSRPAAQVRSTSSRRRSGTASGSSRRRSPRPRRQECRSRSRTTTWRTWTRRTRRTRRRARRTNRKARRFELFFLGQGNEREANVSCQREPDQGRTVAASASRSFAGSDLGVGGELAPPPSRPHAARFTRAQGQRSYGQQPAQVRPHGVLDRHECCASSPPPPPPQALITS